MSKRIERIFSDISGVYDIVNHIYSLGIDISWRQSTVRAALANTRRKRIAAVDIGTGTGDLAIALAEEAARDGITVSVNGIDLNSDMLSYARVKLRRREIRSVRVGVGDALNTGFGDDSFDLAVSAFTLRNLDDLDVFSKELMRILKKGGRFVLTDMAGPDNRVWHAVFKAYFWTMAVVIGGLLDREAYAWLYRSVMEFDKLALVQTFRRNGFRDVRIEKLFSGVGFMVVGTK